MIRENYFEWLECSVEKVKQARLEQVLKDAGTGMIPDMLQAHSSEKAKRQISSRIIWDNDIIHINRYADKELPALIKEAE